MSIPFSGWRWFERKRGRPPRRKLVVEQLEARSLLSATLVTVETEPNNDEAHANLLAPNALVSGALDAPGDVDYFSLHLSESSSLRISVAPRNGSALDSRLRLFNSDSFLFVNGLRAGGGGLLSVSDDRAPGDPNPLIERTLLPGDYFIEVSAGGPGARTGAYTLSTQFVPGPSPFFANQEDAPGQRVGDNPVALVTGDFNRDGIVDVASANRGSGDVSVLLGIGDNGFQPQMRFKLPAPPVAIAVLDINQDGRLDLVTKDDGTGLVSILVGVGDGSFLVPKVNRLPLTDPSVAKLFKESPALRVSGDFNRDGTDDSIELVPVNKGQPPFKNELFLNSSIPAVLHLSAEVPFPPFFIRNVQEFLDSRGVPLRLAGGRTPNDPSRARPLIGDLNGDGADDVVTMGPSGKIFARLGRPAQPGVFDPPMLVNPGSADAARVITLVANGPQLRVAALDLLRDRISLYTLRNGQWQRSDGPRTGVSPVNIAAADLDGDGRDDLVVSGSLLGPLFIYLGRPDGSFAELPPVPVASEGSGLALTDVNGDGRSDILLTNQISSDVDVLVNAGLPPGTAGFGPELRFRGGIGVASVFESSASLIANRVVPGAFPPLYFPISTDETHSVVVDDFNGDGIVDVVATNRGQNNFALLLGKGTGGLVDPQIFAAGDRPTALRSADFNGDGKLDLAILNAGSATYSIFLGNGSGGFHEKLGPDGPLLAGKNPTGFVIRDVNGDGKRDLVGGNELGDVLTLLGNGDGTFQPFRRADRSVTLAVADLNGDGKDDFIFANEGLDHVFVNYSQPGSQFLQGRQDGVLAPGAVRVTDLNGDGRPDVAVANGGGNSVLVYLGTANGQLGPRQEFFVGTNPVGLTVADVNADSVPDLVVANQGSNDVSLLLGQGQGNAWTLTQGPRLQAGQGPVSTTVTTRNGVAELAVTNSLSNDVWVLPGVGDGLFSDQPRDIQKFSTGANPQQSFLGNFDDFAGLDLVTINAGSGGLTFISNFNTSSQSVPIGSGGARPMAALEGDFNHDGMEDLVIANNGDGGVSLLLGGHGGPHLDQVLTAADAPHPTAVVFRSESDGELGVYVADESTDAAIPLTFRLDAGIPIVDSGSSRSPSVDLLSAGDGTVGIIPTLVTGGAPRTTDTDRSADASPVGESEAAAPREDAGTGPATRIFLADSEDGEEGPPTGPPPNDSPESDAGLKRFVTGQDEKPLTDPPLTPDELPDLRSEPGEMEVPPAPIDEAFRQWSSRLEGTTRVSEELREEGGRVPVINFAEDFYPLVPADDGAAPPSVERVDERPPAAEGGNEQGRFGAPGLPTVGLPRQWVAAAFTALFTFGIGWTNHRDRDVAERRHTRARSASKG